MSSTNPDKRRQHPDELLKEHIAELKAINEQLQAEIAERKKAEDALWRSQVELSTIWDNTPMVMILVDQERRARKVNLTAARFAQ
ncbi:MAG: hypothetical protein V3V32_01735, partial [Dehalococcoidia bacterium]